MKQHITEEQLNELSDIGKKTLKEWGLKRNWNNEKPNIVFLTDGKVQGWLPLLSIGQMIEFLNDRELRQFTSRFMEMVEESDKELCDALWEAVKEVLNER